MTAFAALAAAFAAADIDPTPVPAPEGAVRTANVVMIQPQRSVPAASSASLTLKAWKALEAGKYEEAILITDETETRFGVLARRQQQQLKDFAPPERAAQYAALNDVATSLFICGRALRALKRGDEAREVFLEIGREYRFAQCWDPKGWFWKVASAAQDEIDCIDYGVDFGDYTSETLTTRAWKAYQAREYTAVELYVNKCLELYTDAALKMQAEMDDFAPRGQESDYWALNDVATCLLIRGKSLQRQRRNRDAATAFSQIIDRYPYAQCWNPNGHYWRVADAARRSLSVHSP